MTEGRTSPFSRHLEFALTDPCSWVRIGAARALSSMPLEEAQPLLLWPIGQSFWRSHRCRSPS